MSLALGAIVDSVEKEKTFAGSCKEFSPRLCIFLGIFSRMLGLVLLENCWDPRPFG